MRHHRSGSVHFAPAIVALLAAAALFARADLATAQPAKHDANKGPAQAEPIEVSDEEEGVPYGDAEVDDSDAAATPAPKKRDPDAPREPTAGKVAVTASGEPVILPPTPNLEPNEAARRSVTGGLPPDEPDHGAGLLALEDVDQVLFPSPSEGLNPMAPLLDGDGGNRPVVLSSGVPGGELSGSSAKHEPLDLSWLAGLKQPDFPVRYDARVVRYLDYFRNSSQGRATIAAWLKRSGRFREAIKAVLRRHSLPEDVVWLALMESGFNPSITSPAGAVGLWQFTPKAAEAYGLKVDRAVDERKDPHRSSEAAARYLADLHKRFGNWELAFAAYNMGYGGLLTAVRKYNTNDFWRLASHEAGVPYETALYVAKISAVAIVSHNCEVFGTCDLELEDAIPFDVVAVAPGTSVEAIAKAAGTEPSTINSLNPQLAGSAVSTSPGPESGGAWLVRVPAESGADAQKSLPSPSGKADLEQYIVRWGESLSDVADSHNVSKARIRMDNGLGPYDSLRPGMVLLLPNATPAKSTPSDREVVVVPPLSIAYTDRRRVFYEVVWQDTVDDVAFQLGVSPMELRNWNQLDSGARLQSGMVLQAFVAKDREFPRVALREQSEVEVLTVGSDAFFEHFESEKGRYRIVVTIQNGESWKSLSKRYGISLGMLERINQRSRRSDLVAGETVIVYSKTPPQPLESAALSAPTEEVALDGR